MAKPSFYNKVLNYLGEVNKGKQSQLIKYEYITQKEAEKINTILEKLDLIKKEKEEYQITKRGLNILLYHKIGKLGQEYNEKTLKILLTAETS